MNKFFFTIMLAMMCVVTANAQRTFKMNVLTDNEEVFELPDDDSRWEMMEKAGVCITCDSSKPLTFESNLDVNIEMLDTEVEGNNSIYYLLFDVSENRKRQLNVSSNGYYTFTIDLNMRKQHIYRYELFDPNDALDATKYQKYREQALNYFDDCYYLEAKEQFQLAARCDDATAEQKEEARQHANECDSIITWRRLGNEAANVLDYELAMEYFSKAQALNSQDRYVVERYAECSAAQNARSIKFLNAAEEFFMKKEYEDAIFLYQKVEALGYSNAGTAISRRIQAERLNTRRKEAEHYLGFEYGLANKIKGFTYGNYRNRSAGYFTMKFNGALFELARQYNLNDMAEVDISFGWTVPLVKKMNQYFRGVYLHFGPGVALLNRFKPNTKNEYLKAILDAHKSETRSFVMTRADDVVDVPSTDVTDTPSTGVGDGSSDNAANVPATKPYEITQQDIEQVLNEHDNVKRKDLLDLGIGVAITPEVGLAVKVWRFAIRGTFQYRFAIDKAYQRAFKKAQFSLGIGYCF